VKLFRCKSKALHIRPNCQVFSFSLNDPRHYRQKTPSEIFADMEKGRQLWVSLGILPSDAAKDLFKADYRQSGESLRHRDHGK